MSEHHAAIRWVRTSADFTYDSYNRDYEILFNQGAIVVPASAAPGFKGDPSRVDPEEAFIASLASCHMLTFLALCARKRIAVESYEDEPVGYLEKGENGRIWLARVVLQPRICFAPGSDVDAQMLAHIHHDAHEHCFIANSVKTDVSVALPE